ncbi:MAG: lamin tail domain-containing protein [Candidatus Marinimicrobia bacterium]|nr:lamin tail domain-containing protein [Candidatus Neomarinimicrobiota bacterium]
MQHKSLSRFALSLLLVAICVRTSGSTLVINEVMFDPHDADYYDEFIELFNAGDSSVSVNGMQLNVNDISSGLLIVDSSLGLVVKPGGFALIMEKDYFLNYKSTTYDELIPDSTLRLVISTNAFGTGGLKNTTPNLVALVSADSETLSIVTTTPNQSSGYSDERIEPDSSDASENWGDSRQLFGTPGYRNSISPLPFDLFLSRFSCLTDSQSLETGKTIDFSIIVKNIGENSCDSALILFGEDHNGDSILSSQETLFSTSVELAPKDSIEISTSTTFNHSGIHQLIANVSFSPDDQPDNNRQTLEIRLPFQRHCLAINEFMYCPASGSGGEWIELLNISADTINLRDWTIGDNSTTVTLTKSSYFLPPDEFVVIANDSLFLQFWGSPPHFLKSAQSIPALNNTNDSILVNDLCGRRIDGLGYSKTWGYRTNYSLERKNPFILSNSSSNWTLSASSEGGTPGQPNAILLKSLDLRWENSNTFLKNDRLLPGESLNITYSIENNGIGTISEFQVSFDFLSDTNASVMPVSFYQQAFTDSIISLQKSLDSISVPIDFAGSGFIKGRILFNDADSANNVILLPVKIGYPAQSIVINEFMCQPESGNTEWIELFNRSESSVNLRNWSLKHASSTIYPITDSAIFIQPKSFAVVTAGENIGYEISSNIPVIIPGSFPALTNSADSIVIIDAAGQRTDALKYESTWGIRAGVSLERIDPDGKSSDPSNWKQSKDTQCATPGMMNSNLKCDYDLAIVSFTLIDSVIESNESATFSICIKNAGKLPVASFSLEIFSDANSDSLCINDERIWFSPTTQVLDPDSTVLFFGEISNLQSGKNSLIAHVVLDSDDFIENDVAYSMLRISFPEQSLVINEFLPYPNSEQVEFIELINLTNDSIDLADWTLSNLHTRTNLASVRVSPDSYSILSADSSFFTLFAPSSAGIVILEKWPGMNNVADVMILKDLTGKTIDSVFFNENWKPKQGISFEKLLPVLPGSFSDSWRFSVSLFGATAGFLNSVTPYDQDLAIDSITTFDNIGDTLTVFSTDFIIHNTGKFNSSSAYLIVEERICQQFTEVLRTTIPSLTAGENRQISCSFGAFNSGIHHLQAIVQLSGDEHPANDTIRFDVIVAFPPASLLISEFLAFPNDALTAGSSIAEYAEFYNPTNQNISLEGWTYSDENTGRPVAIGKTDSIRALDYFVVANDSSIFHFPNISPEKISVIGNFPSLNNDEDRIFIFDPTMVPIDSVWFTSLWKIEQNIAMERVFFTNPNNHQNWRSSVSPSGGTPGQKNSVSIDTKIAKPGIQVEPNPFSPDGDSQDDEAVFHYRLPFPSARISLEIFDVAGRLIYKPANHLSTSSEGVIYWNGESKYSEKARTGIYIVKCTAIDSDGKKTVGYVTTVALVRGL